MSTELQGMDQLEEARTLFEEALQARKETLGDRHPDTLRSISSMAWLLSEMGQLEEARLLFQDVEFRGWA